MRGAVKIMLLEFKCCEVATVIKAPLLILCVTFFNIFFFCVCVCVCAGEGAVMVTLDNSDNSDKHLVTTTLKH